ncbi:MAG: ExbD/TolR family protein [Steroidobacteraceae bacterium]
MGMNVGGGGEDEAMSNINTTPLVDVMLVLLIIFLITIPVITQTVKLDLPDVVNQASQPKPDDVTIAVDEGGQLYWNVRPITPEELLERLKVEAIKVPQPEVNIQGDRNVRFEFIGKAMVMCQRAGIVNVGFISQPKSVGASSPDDAA